jgi:hypothetical protein
VAAWRNYSNNAIADSLAVSGGGNMSTSATSIYAASGSPTGYPTPPFILQLEPSTSNFEMVLVGSGAGTSGSPWIVSRGADGTSARAHVAGTAIMHTLSAGDLTQAATHYASGSGSGVHGLPAAAWLTGAFATISEVSTTAGQTTVSFSSIPQTYKHLLLVGQGRLAETSVYSDDINVQFNGDASSVYSYLTMLAANPGGTMTGPSTGTAYAQSAGPLFRFMASQAGSAANAGGGFAVIPNYTGTSYNKTYYSVSGGGDGTSSFVDLRVRTGIYAPSSQTAITSLAVIAPAGGFDVNCSICLYGLG